MSPGSSAGRLADHEGRPRASGVRCAAVDVRLLGELEAFDDDGTPLAVRGVKARTLLATLALHRGEPVGPDRLFDILWGEELPGNPANALQALVATLRRAVGAAKVTTTDAGYALAIVERRARRRPLRASRRRRAAASSRPATPTPRPSTLREALALCRDEPLVEFAYAEFATGERARLEELVLVAIGGQARRRPRPRPSRELAVSSTPLCEQHPLRERLWELRMLALYRSGRQADALRAYADARERLIEEFGIEPGPALRELEGRVLAQDPDARPPPVDPRGARVPQDPSATSASGSRASSAATPTSPGCSIRSNRRRLVTLIGPGGAGKTRLAVEAATSLQATLPDGAWLVELAGVLDPDGIAPALAAALHLGRAERVDGATVVDHIVATLRRPVPPHRPRQLRAPHRRGGRAGRGRCSARLPDLRVLATSREALGVPGELLLPVGGLGLDAAVDVFADRARAVRSGFVVDDDTRPLVEDVCRRLDGLPLALELAAARLRALPLPQLAELLDDRFRVLTGGARTALPRQQTLRAVVDWSYDLLFEDERRLFGRLAVFAGGWSLDAATAVCSDDLLPADDIIDLLLHLVDKSLVVADLDADGRWPLLPAPDAVALRPRATGGDARRRRRARAARPTGTSSSRAAPGTGCGARRVRRGGRGSQAEWENLRVALDWFVERGDADGRAGAHRGRSPGCGSCGASRTKRSRWLDDALVGARRRAVVTRQAPRCGGRLLRGLARRPRDRCYPSCGEAIEVLRHAGHDDRLGDALLMAAELQHRAEDAEPAEATLRRRLGRAPAHRRRSGAWARTTPSWPSAAQR